MILSVCIVTLETRNRMFRDLMTDLENQLMRFEPETVEILVKSDNGEATTGAKRDYLLRKAQGKYISYIDDDDEVSPFYLSEIVRAAKQDCDTIAINGMMTTDGSNEIRWELSMNHPNVTIFTEQGRPKYLRTTNHLSPVKLSIAQQGGFPDIRNGEDKAYSESIFHLLKTEATIHIPLYHYKFTTTQKLYK